MNKGRIEIINTHVSDYSMMPNYWYIGRSKNGNPLGNPFTFDGQKNACKAKLSFKTREECVEAYEKYFKIAYGQKGFEALTKRVDEIYRHYKNGENIYLGCFCNPDQPCHGKVIAKFLQEKLIKETLEEKKKTSTQK